MTQRQRQQQQIASHGNWGRRGPLFSLQGRFLMRDSHVLSHGMNFKSLFKNIRVRG